METETKLPPFHFLERKGLYFLFHWSLFQTSHYSDVTMSAIASQITGVSIICSTVCFALLSCYVRKSVVTHDEVIKWKHFPRYWPFVRGIHRSPVYSPHKGQLRWALMFPLICAWMNGSVNNREADDLRRHRAHYDVTVMTDGSLTQVQ